MTIFTPDPRPAVEWLFLDGATSDLRLSRWLTSTLPLCAWTCHVVATCGDADGRILDAVTGHLEANPIALVHLHLVTDGRFGRSPSLERLLGAAEIFQREAYRERTGARLIPLPILEVRRGNHPRPALDAAAELGARMAKPSLLMREPPSASTSKTAERLGLRIYLGDGQATTTALEVVTAAHVLDSCMDRVERPDSLLAPCRTHAVVAAGELCGCTRQWHRGVSRATLDDGTAPVWQPDDSLCPACIAEALVSATPSLKANLRHREGRELTLRTSVALAETGETGAAAEVAAAAEELSVTDAERADALIQRGLCLLAEGRLADADAALLDAAAAGAPHGTVAYQRARIQVAWRDDIEALDRYAEALAAGTDAVSEEDLNFEMALSHIRLEEWSDARSHLELAGGPRPEIAFNLGVCDVNDNRAERALSHFDEALALGPAPDDLGRVHFFRGFCLKELGLFADAVTDLVRSMELEAAESAHHNLLGFCYFKLGRHTEAVASFRQAVILDPGSAIDWANIGVNLERLGETRRAAEMYHKALRMDPSIGFAREGLGRLGQ